MKIIFRDFYDKEVPEAQAVLMEEYSKVFITPGSAIKKEEYYDNGELKLIHYFKDNKETEEQAKSKLKEYNVAYLVKERRSYGDLSIIRANYYEENLLVKKWNFLADADDFILCTQPLDMNSGEPIYGETTKYLGEYTNDLEPNYCKFNYDDKGNFTYCGYNYVRDYESEIIELDGLPVIKERFELTDEMYDYYLTAELLPPLT